MYCSDARLYLQKKPQQPPQNVDRFWGGGVRIAIESKKVESKFICSRESIFDYRRGIKEKEAICETRRGQKGILASIVVVVVVVATLVSFFLQTSAKHSGG